MSTGKQKFRGFDSWVTLFFLHYRKKHFSQNCHVKFLYKKNRYGTSPSSTHKRSFVPLRGPCVFLNQVHRDPTLENCHTYVIFLVFWAPFYVNVCLWSFSMPSFVCLEPLYTSLVLVFYFQSGKQPSRTNISKNTLTPHFVVISKITISTLCF